jgi:putative MATE family efflux protein
LINDNHNLTEGGILRKLFLVAVPIMGTQVMQMAYNLIDMMWLGRLSADAVAASGTAGMYLWLSMGFFILGSMGTEIGVSQSMGRNDTDTAQKFAQNGMLIALITGVLFGGAMIVFTGPLIGIFNIQEANVAEDAMAYLKIVSIGMPFFFVSAVMRGAFTASGNAKLPFYINAVGITLNIVLDPLFIFTFGWGIEGAAWATVVAQGVVFILSILAIKLHKDRPFKKIKFFVKPDLEIIRRILRWSFPVSMESLLFTSLAMITTRILAGFGMEALTVQRVGSQVEALSWLIGGGFGAAVTIFMGQNFGAKKWGRIRRGFDISLGAMTVWGILVSLGLFFGGYIIFSAFIDDHGIRTLGATYLKIFAISQIPMCVEAVAAGTFRGKGKTVPPSVASITSNVIRVPLVYFLSKTPLGLDGVWWGIVISTVFRSAWILGWYLYSTRGQPTRDENLQK